MNHYIIDGNNLIGKNKSLKQLQNKNKQASREGLIKFINKYFSSKNAKLTLHLDGHSNNPLSISKGKIVYSENQPSDNLIRKEIEHSKNPKLIVLVTSDRSLMNFGKVNSCKIISSEEFNKLAADKMDSNDEASKIKQLEKERDEFVKLFGQ
jgi:predicted RNA-binding protein with PIN domain